MAEVVVSMVVERIRSIAQQKIGEEVNLVSGVGEKIIGLSEELKTIRNVLDDAENKGAAGDKAVGEWLKKLENTSYELEDVLDEWYTAVRMFQTQEEQKCEVCNCTSFISIPSWFHKLVVRRDVAKKLESVKQKIDSIKAEKNGYGLVPMVTSHSSTVSQRVQSTSVVEVAEIYGRDIEREDLVKRVILAMLQAGDQTNHLQILSIVGVGGVGKTALAQLVYNDSRVIDCFELRIWICVSDPFDEVRVAKYIIENVTGKSPESNQLGFLLGRVKECISGKKFLLVMDDVWTEDPSKWEPLITCLKNGSIGSKVLVTTRNERVAKIMGSLEGGIHRLIELSDKACWLLLQRIALSGRDGGEWKRFESIGMKIANKCKGLPLAAKALGSLLRFKNSLEEWENILNSEIWNLENLEKEEDKIFPHLRLSYNELSPTLKRCFSYCAVFPKDTRINVEILIEQWMAVGYLCSDGSGIGDMELRGRDYFDKLAMRCLFQDFEKDDLDGQIKYCKMHDIVHDFALSLRKNGDAEVGIRNTSTCEACSSLLVFRAKEYRCVYFGKEEPRLPQCNCLANLRVVSLIGNFQKQRIPHGIERFIHLRWLDLSWNGLAKKDLVIICQLYNLQTLLLQHCDIKELPREIGNLIHLRHLNLNWNVSLKELPESICDLHELQILNINNCSGICRLPQGLHRLEKLKHLHNTDNYSFEQFPQGVAQLTGLCTLNEFRGKSKLGWLKNLNRLSGSLKLEVELFGSENIVDATEGELKKKDGIQELVIKFRSRLDEDGDCEWVNLLDALEPHPNLLKLQIYSYEGSKLPSWMVFPVLNKLKFIRLDGFSRLLSLLPLGRLPCLEEIVINRIDKLQVVGQEFLGTTTEGSNSSSSIAFPKLKRLTFEHCDNWREWEDITTQEVVMPCLMELNIHYCKSLTALPHRLLASSSLEKLDICYSTALEVRYGERQGSAWKSISDIHPCLRLIYSFCFDSVQHGLVTTSHVELPAEINGQDITVKRDDLVGRMVDQTNHLQILSIVGDEGVGKTTLAQLVYNDSRVRECFELRIWIHDPFKYVGFYASSGVRVAKAIIGSVTKECPDSNELEFLLQSLKDCISGKKFLIVMDDVCKEDASEWKALIAVHCWEPLRTSLKNGSIDSKVLVTTSSKMVAIVMGSPEDEIPHLVELSDKIAS